MVQILILHEVERRYDDCYIKRKLYRKTKYILSSNYTLVIISPTKGIYYRVVDYQSNETRRIFFTFHFVSRSLHLQI